MQLWALLELVFAIATAAGCFALIIGEIHVIEQVEGQELWEQLKEKIANIGVTK